ncbi:MAG: hypothetical protein CM1200mP30_23130 [Pseudomonadota bacterium]|nr:MAG: hypothetical protein CM1200mP30_23130 [Pseudomonadota bacterium]
MLAFACTKSVYLEPKTICTLDEERHAYSGGNSNHVLIRILDLLCLPSLAIRRHWDRHRSLPWDVTWALTFRIILWVSFGRHFYYSLGRRLQLFPVLSLSVLEREPS